MIVAATLLATSCGSSTAPSPGGLSARGSVNDPAGDALVPADVPVAPDLVAASIDVSGGNVVLRVTFAPGTLSRSHTRVVFSLDTDRDPATGAPGVDSGGRDAAFIGVDYFVQFVQPLGSVRAVVGHNTGSGVNITRTAVGTGVVTFPGGDDVQVVFPAAVLGGSAGPMTFKVNVAQWLSTDEFTGTLDNMPDIGLPPGIAR